ncbi:unnamed protein product [Angiostrongylus costaricensis]|uniref:Cytoplasmic polyadenylation element-binding protein 1 n=1 Tax=Angiostrongylus costaricensis TaxID=334426 RepID=A0A158PF75_ANGCS|nr:unnamed protein product [Angiostrongylus costaricensis]
MTDEQFDEYREKICEGVRKLMEGITLADDCCLRESSPFKLETLLSGALEANYDYQYNLGPEIYSRKVFVGGLPIGIKEGKLIEIFTRFGPLMVDWPRKNGKTRWHKPKGCAFLIFNLEMSVRKLVESCRSEGEKLFFLIHSPADREMVKVQIRPWRLEDSDYSVDVNVPINLHLVVFVGGMPIPFRAVDLAHTMDRLFGNVACAGIDTDFKYKYPRGAGRVAFTDYSSYIKAIREQYVQLNHGEIEKSVEIKPYVLDDQLCEECVDKKNGGKHAPFFCPHVDCLQYYCESCWTLMHSTPLRKHHEPLIKEA